MTDQEKEAVKAVERAKNGPFKATGIKVELEAIFHRGDSPYECPNDCDGDNEMDCPDCEGEGGYYDAQNEWQVCADCEGTGLIECTDPFHDNTNWNNQRSIHDFILEQLVPLGLAQPLVEESSDFAYKYKVAGPLLFSKVYFDMTVDTEMTFTIDISDPENVLLIPKIMQAFLSIADAIGQGIDVSTAGMHISYLNSEGAFYPVRPTRIDERRFENFKKSMTLLLPALFFLATPNAKTRSLGYRTPAIGEGGPHYNAIHYGGGALEFRIFDTCYENPMAILDDIIVMSKCLRFWSSKYVRNHLDKVTTEFQFGLKEGGDIAKFYVMREHIELLNRGLRMIKPDYLTIKEIKRQRNFTSTIRSTKKFDKEMQERVAKAYKQYESRFSWELLMLKHNFIYTHIEQHFVHDPTSGEATPEKLKQAEEEADRRVKDYEKSHKKSLREYAKENPHLTQAGSYHVCVA